VFAPIRQLDPKRPFEVHQVESLRRGGSSDHGPFLGAGVPAFHWRQTGEGYRHIHHTQNDVFALARAGDLKHSALVVALAALGFANLDHPVDRTDMLEPEDRKLGIQLAGLRVAELVEGGLAQAAGWQAGDEILLVDGVELERRSALVELVQEGEARKTFTLKRGEETVESVIDWSQDPEEPARERWRARRAAREQAAPKDERDSAEAVESVGRE
jgi:hypothetical protein